MSKKSLTKTVAVLALIGVTTLLSVVHGTEETKTKAFDKDYVTLYIENENDCEVGVIVSPSFPEQRDPEKMDEVSTMAGGWLNLRLPAKSESKGRPYEVKISRQKGPFGTAKWFSVRAQTSEFTPMGCCYNLRITDDNGKGTYHYIRFTNETYGTNCKSQRLESPLTNVRKLSTHIPYKLHRAFPDGAAVDSSQRQTIPTRPYEAEVVKESEK